MVDSVLRVTSLTKRYGSFTAVKGISFAINAGEIVGLLGPNGAGKTTTIQMLLALTTPTSGAIEYFGMNLQSHREAILQRINYVSAYSEMQSRVTVFENLEVFAMLYGVNNAKEKIKRIVEMLGISHKMSSLFWNLSSGEKARVNMAKALLNDPELILMDEPTASLDPEIVHTILDVVSKMRREKHVAILYTSHNMSEVSRICDRVIFLDHGTILAEDTPVGLSRRVADTTLRLTIANGRRKVETYCKKHHIEVEFESDTIVSCFIHETAIPSVLFGFRKAGIDITGIEIENPNLEDVFLAVAKGGKHALE